LKKRVKNRKRGTRGLIEQQAGASLTDDELMVFWRCAYKSTRWPVQNETDNRNW